MALETASYVANLVPSNPDGGDQASTADDHIRLIKAAMVRTFPKLDSAVSLSAVQFTYTGDLSASVQMQINALRDGPNTANYALYANSASYATKAGYAESASYAVRSSRAESASYAAVAGQATLAITANSASYAALAGTATNATFATNAGSAGSATNATNATNAQTANNALLLGGASPDEAANGGTVAKRNASGDLFARYHNQTSSVGEAGAINSFITTQGDDYFRKATPAQAGTYMEARNISGRTGTAKTLSPSAPTGGSNGDLWYQY